MHNKIYIILLSLIMAFTFNGNVYAKNDEVTSDEYNDKIVYLNDTYNEDSDSQYATKRIIVKTSNLNETYNCIDCLYYDGLYLLQYETKEDTKYAYNQLKEIYGDSVCLDAYLSLEEEDEVIHEEDVDESAETVEGDGHYSWGTAFLGLDKMISDLEAESSFDEEEDKVTVAIIDSGVNENHKYLKDRLAGEIQYDLIDDDNTADDEYGHGTHVAGIIADGTSSNVKILPIRVCDEEGHGCTLSLLWSALEICKENDVDVVNISLAIASRYGDNIFNDILKELYDRNILVCVAAGNYGYNADYYVPSNSPYVYSVTALDEDGSFASEYSNYGSTVDFSCPGTNILSTWIDGTKSMHYDSGTSMAAPEMAAVCALLKTWNPDLSVEEYTSVLKENAVDLGEEGFDNYYGYGTLDMSTFVERNGVISKYITSATLNKTSFTFNNAYKTPGVTVYDADGNIVDSSNYKVVYSNNLNAGTASVYIYGIKNYRGNIHKIFTIKQVSITSATINKSVFYYDGSVKYPTTITVYCNSNKLSSNDYSISLKKTNKVPGSYSVTIKGTNNYTGKIVKTYTIKIKPTTIKSITSKTKAFKLTWNKQTSTYISGYQIEYSTSSKFTNAKKVNITSYKTTSKIIKSLKTKKKYYVRIRTYKKVNNTKYYSAWSSYKTITTK